MVDVVVLRVFVDAAGAHGSYLGVVVDSADVSAADRASIARRLGFAETIFVESVDEPRISVESLTGTINFAGPVVGAAWLLRELRGELPRTIQLRDGPVSCWEQGADVWVRAQLRWMPPWWHERLASPGAVEQLSGARTPAQDAVQVWAWENETLGTVRARTFAPRFDVLEEEACGSASMKLAAALGREIVVKHGAGSRILAGHGPAGYAAVGGLTVKAGARRVL